MNSALTHHVEKKLMAEKPSKRKQEDIDQYNNLKGLKKEIRGLGNEYVDGFKARVNCFSLGDKEKAE